MLFSPVWRFYFMGFFGLWHENQKNSHSKRSGFSGDPQGCDLALFGDLWHEILIRSGRLRCLLIQGLSKTDTSL